MSADEIRVLCAFLGLFFLAAFFMRRQNHTRANNNNKESERGRFEV